MAKATKKTHNLTQDVEPATSTSKPKTVKICCRQSCSKCSKKIRRPKVQKPKKKSKKTLPSMPNRKTTKKPTPPKKRTNKGKGKELFGHYRRLLKELSTGTGKEPQHSSTESSRISTSE
ncbi:uncharacterized protein LOC110313268 [Mus pahari]|uniref:uncharacterized protein LOC110313268 n=1 Tax=Mus pahari TaxID=10093 RepID=UPI000A30B118|nr:uncharacterized protein LOC110313268 [Mus pahari]